MTDGVINHKLITPHRRRYDLIGPTVEHLGVINHKLLEPSTKGLKQGWKVLQNPHSAVQIRPSPQSSNSIMEKPGFAGLFRMSVTLTPVL
jgi:hypothetical protein